MSLAGCGDSTGKISEINQSPSGKYQIDEVNWSGGATAVEDVGQLLEDSCLLTENNEGQPQIFEIAANSCEMFTVVFRGSKGPADTKVDRNLPPWIYLYYYG